MILQLLELEPALGALKGVAMELDDCAFPLLHGVVQTSDEKKAFEGAYPEEINMRTGREEGGQTALIRYKRLCPISRSTPKRKGNGEK